MKHTHKYLRTPYGKSEVFKCVNCPHYVPTDLIVGRESVCWFCGKTFTISIARSKKARPTCGCKRYETESVAPAGNVDDLLAMIGGDKEDAAD